MAFEFPAYHHPDFTQPALLNAPDARWEAAEKDGVAPEEYHSTSMYPEYFKINGKWTLAEESSMDSCVVLEDDGTLSVVESRNLKKGQRVMLGRTEHGEDGIYMHCNGFSQESETLEDQFVFRHHRQWLLPRPAGGQRPGYPRSGGRTAAHGTGPGYLHPAVSAQRTLQPPGCAE